MNDQSENSCELKGLLESRHGNSKDYDHSSFVGRRR